MNEEELLKMLRETFRLESEERLESISRALIELEKANRPDAQKPIIELIFREAHSLKGAARAVNLEDIEGICQAVESVFNALKQDEIQVSQALIDELYAAIGAIESAMERETPENAKKTRELIDRLSGIQSGRTPDPLPQDRQEKDEKKKHRDKDATPPLEQMKTTPENLSREKESAQKKKATIDEKEKEEGEIEEIEEEEEETGEPEEIIQEEEVAAEAEPEPSLPEETPQDTETRDSCDQSRENDTREEARSSKPATGDTIRISTTKLDTLLLEAEEFTALKLVSSQRIVNLRELLDSYEIWKKKWNRIEPDFRRLKKENENSGTDKAEHAYRSGFSQMIEFCEWNHEYMMQQERSLRTLTKSAEQNHRLLSKMVDDLLDDMKKIMMLPFSTLVNMFPRMVRELSRNQFKEVDLEIRGADIEIDRRILEEMKDPLVHMIRNSIDHGLEHPDVRVKQGKPQRGNILLEISQAEGSKIEILLADDGAGINVANLKEKAVKAGIITEKTARGIDDTDAMSLIFRSGLSSTPIVTEISGRGLGMAIVQERVEKLGGLLTVDSTPGKGTSFRMLLPVTLATFRGVLVKVAGHEFIVPGSHVECVVRLQKKDVKTVENRATIPLKGDVLSLLDLQEVLRLPGTDNRTETDDGITVMVLGAGTKRMAFRVSEIICEQEVLVKSLGRQLSKVPNVAGATILGSGKVVPILSVLDLLKSPAGRAVLSRPGQRQVETEDEKETEEEADEFKSVLVVEDSITSRMLIKNILESAGYIVKTAVDGQDAYTQLKTEDFHVVVSDVEMPRMNGFELTEAIRGTDKISEIPVVLLTSLDSREDREKGIDAGADAYLVKTDFDQTNLLEVISRLV